MSSYTKETTFLKPDSPPQEAIESPPESHSVAFYTLGCKTNQLESSTLADMFREEGWKIVPFDEAASVYVVNTCTVTGRSDNESRRIIRRARLSNPNGRIVVTGCYAQVAPQELAALDGVNDVIGNNYKQDILQIIKSTPISETPVVRVSEIDKSRIMVGATRSDISRTRGSLKIQDGCDYKCTYCIIWEARGKSRSLPIPDIRVHLEHMLTEGFKEIVLTGINIGQYSDDGLDLSDLLSALICLPGNFRLRLSSLDPMEVTDKLIDVVANSNGKICPHFHLSAQSAEDHVLKRMARRHHVADMIRVCKTIANKVPEASIGSDIIAGFPGETAEKFEQTYHVLQDVPMNYFHVFSYSERRGTPAADFLEPVPEPVRKERANRLKSLSDQKHMAYRQRFIDRELDVIVEESCQKGMSGNYLRVNLNPNGHTLQPNSLVSVRISNLDGERTLGEVTGILQA